MAKSKWMMRGHERLEFFECALMVVSEDSEPLRVIMVDIGIGGVQIRCKNRLKIGQSIFLKVGHDNGHPLSFAACVRYCNFVPDSGLFAIGLTFQPSSHEDKLKVAAFVHSAFKTWRDKLAG